MRTHVLFLAVLVTGLAAPMAVGADVPPEPDDCTLEKQCKDGATCPTLGGEIDASCAAEKTKAGMILKCQQKKAGVAKAVYCKQEKKGCLKSSVAFSDRASGWPFALVALALVAHLRRWRRAS